MNSHPARSGNVIIRAPFFLYRSLLSPLLHAISGASGACRFQPTCSEYAALAIVHHGWFQGSLLAARRLAKCHPFHAPRFDPVPGTWIGSSHPQASSPERTCSPPVTIEEADLRSNPVAHTRTLTVLPHERR